MPIPPVQGPLLEPLIIMESLVIAMTLEFGILFLLRAKGLKNKLASSQEFAYGIFFLGFSTMWIFYIYSDYIAETLELRILFVNLGYTALMIGAGSFIFIIEHNQVVSKNYFYFKLFIIMVGVYVGILIFSITFYSIMAVFFWLMFIIFFTKYFMDLKKHAYFKRKKSQFRLDFIKLYIGFFLGVIGFGLTARIVYETFGLMTRLIGDFFQLASIIFLTLSFKSIPSFEEYDWRKNLFSITLLTTSGIAIYNKNIEISENIHQKTVISTSTIMIDALLKEITSFQGSSVIEKEDKTILIETGEYIFGVIVAYEKLNSLQILLKRYIEKVESIYHNVLKSWKAGDLTVFTPIEKITKEFFF